jgi:O-antigen/teichoic acid export membrane protein
VARSGQSQPRAAPKTHHGSREARFPLFARVRSYAAESLVKNSAFLIINIGIITVSGYGSLTLLTHFFSVNAVGLSAAALAASSLIVSITQSGINYSLPRFLPTSNHRNALINTLHTGVIIATAIGCVIFLVTPFADKMFALGGLLFCIVFIASTCLQAGSSVLGLVLIADRQSGKMTRANMIPSIIKLGAPPLFQSLGNIGAYISRVIYNLFSYIILARLVARRGHRFRPELSGEAVRELGRFSVGMSVATIIGGLPLMMLPIVVLSRLGAAQSAYWSIAITIGSLLNSLPGAVTQALLPEITHRPAERKRLLIRSTFIVTGLVVPALIAAYFAAPLMIEIFGSSYSAGMLSALHWLIFSAFITMLNYASGAILFLAKKSTAITVVNVIDAIIVLGMAGAWATNAQGVAISWFVGDIANTVLFGFFAFLAVREVGFRFEDLGGIEAPSVGEQVRPVPALGSVEQAFDLLASIAEQQRLAARRRPYLNLTEPQGLYTALALQEAEQDWYERRAADARLNETRLDLYGNDGNWRRVPPPGPQREDPAGRERYHDGWERRDDPDRSSRDGRHRHRHGTDGTDWRG